MEIDVPMEQMGQAMVHAFRARSAASHASLESHGHSRTTSVASIQRAAGAYATLPPGSRDTVPVTGHPVIDSGYVIPRNSGLVEPERQRRVLPEVPRKEIRFSSDDVVRAVEQQSAARDQALALRGLR
jgi:hypothetical protein